MPTCICLLQVGSSRVSDTCMFCQALLDAINLPVTSRVRSKVVALRQLGPVATSGVSARRRKRTRDAQRPCRSITSYFNRPLEGAEAEARPG